MDRSADKSVEVWSAPFRRSKKTCSRTRTSCFPTNNCPKDPVPPPVTEMSRINFRTMWGLTILGLLLMAGLLTRVSAVGGSVLLFMFYMAMPPWPGVQEIPSIEHNLIVNKVLVEMIALLAIATLPSGKWFGIDAIVSVLIHRRKKAEK